MASTGRRILHILFPKKSTADGPSSTGRTQTASTGDNEIEACQVVEPAGEDDKSMSNGNDQPGNENQDNGDNKSDVPTILFAMQARLKEATIQERGCKALCQLAALTASGCDEIIEGNGVERICEAMAAHPTNSNVQYYGCGALRNLAINSHSKAAMVAKERIGKVGGLKAVCQAMNRNIQDPDVQWSGCQALYNLTCDNDANKKRAVTAGATDIIRTAMMTHPADAKVQKTASTALRVL